ncbi:hypothetical protein FHW69_003725 [Luteibacter sp. Sphag1AF]|uniref:hypothetical protein n=1 Tax=Luteibacter sp. Sphag1AF TaxID=2587031 RepID=UPI001614F34C|nr:hypothetical protein [Luteibacter sp. Sphag1AF]MBB3229076.1 hypothetical protein [Luteibacter sp. Sphag1AF]
MIKKFHIMSLVAVAALACSGGVAAKGTTWTSLSVEGTPTPGATITLVARVDGRHLVYGDRGTVFGGYIDIYAQGQLIAHIMSATPNTPVTKVVDCGIYVDGSCYAILFGEPTVIRYPYTVPAGATSLQFGARYGGDNESNSSQATDVSVKTVYPSAAVISMLFDN